MRRKEEVFMNSDCGNIIRQTVKKNVLLAVGIVIAVCGAVVISLLPPLVLAKMIDAMTQKQNVGFTFVGALFRADGADRCYGSVKRRISDGIWTENHTCIKKQSYGKVYKTDGRQFKQTGTGRTGITVCR